MIKERKEMIETIVTLLNGKKIVLGTDKSEGDIDAIDGDILISKIDSNIIYIKDSSEYMLDYFKYIEGSKILLKRLNNWLLELEENINDLRLFNSLCFNNMITSHKINDIFNQMYSTDGINYHYITYMSEGINYSIGYDLVNNLYTIDLDESAEPYFDYEKYGRDLRLSGKVKVLNEETILLNLI